MLKVSGGETEKDRISFFTRNNGATAIRNQNGKITFEFTKRKISIIKIFTFFIGILGTPLLVKVFVLIPLIEDKKIGSGWYLIPTFFYLLIAVLSLMFSISNGKKELLRNHGAEHMVFSAYKKLERIPTVEETKRFSRINNSCKISIFSAYITSQIIGFIVYICTGYVIPEMLLYLIPLFFKTIFPFNFIGRLSQFFTTAEPEKHNIELAIAALSALERIELFQDMLSDAISNIFRN